MQRRLFSTFLLASCLGLGMILGYALSETVEPQERKVRSYLPYENRWRLESEIPLRPQGPKQSRKMMIWEVSDYAPVATPEQSAAAQALIEACFESAKRHGWFDIEKSYASGFTKQRHDPIHYRNDEFMLDDRVLDPDRPENLI